MIEQKIFRAYDIRGTYPDQLNKDTAKLIGLGFGTYLQKNLNLQSPNVVVGRDNRTHGEELQQAFIQGLMETGCDVTDVGLSPSPMLYYANTHGEFDGGCNVTASHNPKEYNGFKLITKNGHAVFGDEIQKVYEIIEKGEFTSGKGSLRKDDFYTDYLKKIHSIFAFGKTLKIVVDTGNGIAGLIYPKVLKSLGHEVVELYTELDGTFPNHQPDPIVEEYLEDLKAKVLETGADIGLAFDGDGDRVGVISEKGEFITADKTLMLLAQDTLSRHPGGTIVFTVSNSQSLFELIESWGGKSIMCEVGHSFVDGAMQKNQAVMGGEQSGHFFLPEDYYPYDDALITACRILMILSHEDKTISQLIEQFPKTYSMPESRPYCADETKFKVLEKVISHFKDKYPSNTMDGIRMDFGNGGWAGIRVSNTSPRISITLEAQSQKHLDEIKEIIFGHLKTYSEIDWNK